MNTAYIVSVIENALLNLHPEFPVIRDQFNPQAVFPQRSGGVTVRYEESRYDKQNIQNENFSLRTLFFSVTLYYRYNISQDILATIIQNTKTLVLAIISVSIPEKFSILSDKVLPLDEKEGIYKHDFRFTLQIKEFY